MTKPAKVYVLPTSPPLRDREDLLGPLGGPVEGLPVARKRGRPRDPEADVRILEAAAGLILARGFDNMTVDEVAARAKVGKATVYRRWARKEDLALAALRHLYRLQLPLVDTGSVRGDLHQAYAAVVAFATSQAGSRHIKMAVAESMRDPRIRQIYAEALSTAEDATARCLSRGIRRGEVRTDVPLEYAVEWLIALVTARVIAGRSLPDVDDVDDLVDFVLSGIGEE